MTLSDRLRSLSHEPLAHFLLGGLAIFLFFAWRGTEVDPASRTIVIDEPQVERLATQFSRTFRRTPTTQEIDGLIRDYIKEEVYNREALRLGLDRDDTVIRQRLRQKMEFLARSSAESEQPSDADLQRMLDANPAKYGSGAVISFDQIYLGEGAIAEARAKALLARLGRTDNWRGLGDPLSVPASMERATQADIERQFGDIFASELASLASEPAEVWRGPVPSGFGAHLVRLRAATLPQPPKLSEVRQQVENDWRAATIDRREAAAYQALLDGYTIRIEKP